MINHYAMLAHYILHWYFSDIEYYNADITKKTDTYGVIRMSELKSAMEIALERTRNLRLTRNELEDLKKAELMNSAKTSITRYLEEDRKLEDWDREFARLEASQRDVLIQEMKNLLLERIDLASDNTMVFEGLKRLDGKISAECLEQIRELCTHYKVKLAEESASLEKVIKENLKQSGISGSAIVINTVGSSQWEEVAATISTPYRFRLEELKKSLFS